MPVDLVRRLGAVQAQDLRAFPLALRARTEDPGTLDGLVRAWLMRGTLHLVPAEDVAWMRELLAPRGAAGSRRRLAQLGFDEAATDRAVGEVARALEDGPLTRAEVAALLERAGLPCTGQAPVHVLGAAAARGVLVLGTADEILPAPARGHVPRDPLAELARRHLASRAPAGPRTSRRGRACRWAWRAPRGRASTSSSTATAGPCATTSRTRCRTTSCASCRCSTSCCSAGGTVRRSFPRPMRRPSCRAAGSSRATVTVGGRVAGTWTRERRRALRASPRARPRGRAQARALACGSSRVIVTRASSSAVATPR